MKNIAIGSVCGGRIGVTLVTPDPGGRGTARVELDVYGARYPYKLSEAEARALGDSLLAGAASLSNLPALKP